MLYTVGEMAKEIGVATSTLRYYDQEGLLPFINRTSSGMRMFTDDDYTTLKVIDCLKKSGLTIKEIKAYLDLAKLGDSTLKQRQVIFQKRREMVQEQISEMQKTLAVLDYKCWYYDTAIAQGTEKNVSDTPIKKIPKQYQTGKKELTK